MVSVRACGRVFATCLGAIALLSACIRINDYVRPTYVVRSVHPVSPDICPRVLLLPPACTDCTPRDVQLLVELFRAELVEAGYSVPAPTVGIPGTGGPAPTDPATLQRIAESTGVDAVLVLRVRHYRPYRPPVVDLDASVYTVTGPGLAWELHGVWDPRDGKVAARLERFAEQEIEPSVFRFRHSALLHSPHVFLRFVAHEVVTAMASGELSPTEYSTQTASDPSAPAALPSK